MFELGERAQIDRLEKRIYQLERTNWERADFKFRMTINGLTAAIVVLTIVSIALSASPSGH